MLELSRHDPVDLTDPKVIWLAGPKVTWLAGKTILRMKLKKNNEINRKKTLDPNLCIA